MDIQLCDTCQRLDLSVEKFTINDNRRQAIQPSVGLLRQLNERFPLGTLQYIIDSKPICSLCELISHAVPDPAPPVALGAICHLVWEIDGRSSVSLNATRQNHTRRLRVRWNHPSLKHCEPYLVLAAPSKYDHSDIGYRDLLNKENQFFGRRLGTLESKSILIGEFLRLCQSHASCREKTTIDNDFFDTLKEPYFGVIDIRKKKLVPLPVKQDGTKRAFQSYATVSYVWGSSASRKYRTDSTNIQDRLKHGGLASVIKKLPKALQQSIDLVYSLDIKYIWIDALCIVQDSSHSWNLNARAMHLIYGNSYLTVCAADGDDAAAGLKALDDLEPQQWIGHCAPGVHLILHHPPENRIEVSRWNMRGWTFQERLLSKRSVIFRDGGIYFQCRSSCISEDIFADRQGRGWSLDMVRSPLQRLSELQRQAVSFYVHTVSLYTRRELYEPFDILAAFSGMCKHMEYTMGAPFVFGVPSSHFDFALLWEPLGKSSRLLKPKRSNEPKYKDMKFPSWSWCGWESPAGIAYKDEMVSSCLQDVHLWLSNHTWIDWHIRDGHGTLRRIWDKDWTVEDKSTDEKWRGYTGRRVSEESGNWEDDDVVEESDQSGESDESEGSAGSITADSMPRITVQDRDAANIVSQRMALTRRRGSHYTGDINPIIYHNDDSYGRFPNGPGMSHCSGKKHIDFELTLPEDPYHVRRTTEVGTAALYRDFPDQVFLQFFTWRTSFHLMPAMVDPLNPEQDADGSDSCRCNIIDRRGDKCGSIVVDKEWLRQKWRPERENTGKECEECEKCADCGRCKSCDECTKCKRCEGCKTCLKCEKGDAVKNGGGGGEDPPEGVDPLEGETPPKGEDHLEGEDPPEGATTEFEFIAISDAKSFTDLEFPEWTYYIPTEREDSEWDLFYVLLIEHYPNEGIYRRVALGKVFKSAFTWSDHEWKEVILG